MMTARGSCIAALAAVVLGGIPVQAQMAQDDIVLGLSAASTTYRVYDASAGTWGFGPWAFPTFIQSIEFDNAGLISHNARGNLLGANFGNSYTGFEVYSLATDGTASFSSAWSIVASTGGTRSVNPGGAWLSLRGGGISVSPGNSYFAWTCSDTQQIFVLNYLPGSNPGSGSGVVIGGPRTTASVGGIAPLTSATQGTTWLNDWTLIALNGYGEIVKLDLRNHAVGGSQNNTMAGWQPEVMSDWTVANNDVPLSGQYTSITYNPAVAPNLIFGAATFLGSFEAHLFVYNYNPATQAISLAAQMTVPVRPDGSTLEPREIALDSQGNLYFICYVNSTATLPALPTSHLVAKFTGATNLSNWVDDSHVSAFYDDTQFSSYNGMDVASTLSGLKMGDANGDGQVNTLDLLQLATHWNDGRTFHAFWEGDFNRDGKVNVVDLLYMADKWGR